MIHLELRVVWIYSFSTLPLIASISCLILTFLLTTTKTTKLSFFFLFWWKKRKLCSKFHSHPKKTPQQHGMEPATYVVVFVMMLMFFPLQTFSPRSSCCGHKVWKYLCKYFGKEPLIANWHQLPPQRAQKTPNNSTNNHGALKLTWRWTFSCRPPMLMELLLLLTASQISDFHLNNAPWNFKISKCKKKKKN